MEDGKDLKLQNQVLLDVQRNTPEIMALETFTNQERFIMPMGDKRTNIIDRDSKQCFTIPEDAIPTFFTLLEKCRLSNKILMWYEKQYWGGATGDDKQVEDWKGDSQIQTHSGLMIDFDIMQTQSTSQLDSKKFTSLVYHLMQHLVQLLVFEEDADIHIGIIRRPSVSFDVERKAYKDGFHILIPSIQITKQAKRLLMERLVKSDILETVFKTIEPIAGLTRSQFLDLHSAVVGVFFVGNKSKIDRPPYILSDVFVISYDKQCPAANNIKSIPLADLAAYNISYEFSLNWQVPPSFYTEPGSIGRLPLVIKKQYELLPSLGGQIVGAGDDAESIVEEPPTQARNNGVTEELVAKLVDTLNPRRATNYKEWYEIMMVLVGLGPQFKPIAERFSRQWDRFSPMRFEEDWQRLYSQRHRSSRSIATLRHYAKIDNPERYRTIRTNDSVGFIMKMVHQPGKVGRLTHYDLACITKHIMPGRFIKTNDIRLPWVEFITDDVVQKFLEYGYETHEAYKYKIHNTDPITLKLFLSDELSKFLDLVINLTKQLLETSTDENAVGYHNKVIHNVSDIKHRLGSTDFKNSVCKECATVCTNMKFKSYLDVDQNIMGVGNGILELFPRSGLELKTYDGVNFLGGQHEYFISRYSRVEYKPFDPFDAKTQKVITTIRNMFLDTEHDKFLYLMLFFASTLDGRPKASLFVMLQGGGGNGKSVLMELMKAVLGSYAVKMAMVYLTAARGNNAEAASPALMSLRWARLAYYSETNRSETLNTARIKEMTGQETMSGRDLFQGNENIKLACQHISSQNHPFRVPYSDHAIWRRIKLVKMCIKFVMQEEEYYNPNDKYQRLADPNIQKNWIKDEDTLSAMLSYLVYCYEVFINEYGGNLERVKSPTIEYETNMFRRDQDLVTRFIDRFMVTTNRESDIVTLAEITNKFKNWYDSLPNANLETKQILADQIISSKIEKLFTMPARTKNDRHLDDKVLIGYKFLESNEPLGEGETYTFEGETKDNYVGPAVTADEYIKQLQDEFLRKKQHGPSDPLDAKYEKSATSVMPVVTHASIPQILTSIPTTANNTRSDDPDLAAIELLNYLAN